MKLLTCPTYCIIKAQNILSRCKLIQTLIAVCVKHIQYSTDDIQPLPSFILANAEHSQKCNSKYCYIFTS